MHGVKLVKSPRIARQLPEMLVVLREQLNLLERYSHHAFDLRESRFLPEVAGKLRLLTVRTAHNQPLLFTVADRLQVTLVAKLSGPPLPRSAGKPTGGDYLSLDALFDLEAVAIQTSAGLCSYTKRQLVQAWCQQLDGAHSDWRVDEALINALSVPVILGTMQATALELANQARTTLVVGRWLLQLPPE